jgi:hypothetical protein
MKNKKMPQKMHKKKIKNYLLALDFLIQIDKPAMRPEKKKKKRGK